jgi:hypothetical protein
MNILNISSAINIPSSLDIGKQGENAVTQVAFDFASWQEEFGDGDVQLLAIRNGDDSPYPVLLEIDGTTATWTVSDADTENKGLGKAQYIYMVDGAIAKTAMFYTVVEQSIDGEETDPPEPYQSWVDEVLQAAEDVKEAIASGGYSFTDDGDGNITIQSLA